MSKPNECSPDDLLERSLAEMRQQALPDGPPDELVASTLAALHGAESDEPVTLKLQPQGNKTMRFLMKLAAVIALVSGVAAMLFLASRTNQLALGDVVKKIREAHTMSCSATVELPMTPQQPITMKMYINEAGRMRIESGQGMVQIFDHANGKILMLSINSKQATLATTGAGRGEGAGNWIGAIKSLDTKNAKSLGEKEIDGQKAKGFLVNKEGRQFTFWADPETGAPVSIEVEVPMSGKFMNVVMNDFVLDATLDDALFSLVPPEGFNVRKLDVSQEMSALEKTTGEDHAIGLLRAYAEASDNKFPAKLDDYVTYAKLTTKPANGDALSPAAHAGALMPFLMQVGKGNWGYHGDDAKLGDKDKLIFWYHDPKTQKYRGVFGDLEARDLSKKEFDDAMVTLKREPTTTP
jgi:outer membrane lipoprotein-sorting protein